MLSGVIRYRGPFQASAWFAWCLASLACGCNNSTSGNGASGPQGEFSCDTTPEDCIEIFQGSYEGTYQGDVTGTFSIYIAQDGTIDGTVTDSSGNVFMVSGSVDETGVVEFGSEETGTFSGVIDFDQNVSGSWSGGPGSGAFDGAFVSRDRVTTTSGAGGGGSTTTTTTSGAGGSGGTVAVTYCDRTNAKAVACGVDLTGECVEPVDDTQRCEAECLITLSCDEIAETFPLLDCISACSSDGTRDYCLEYQNKLVDCDKSDTALGIDICTTTATPRNACVWGCVLDASCEAFMAEQELIDSCTPGCADL
jgi:hypothetical protein